MTNERRFVRRVLVVIGLTLLATSLWLTAWYALKTLLAIFAGVLLAIFIRGLALRLQRWLPISRTLALTLVTLGLVLGLGLTAWGFAALMVKQVQQLREDLPKGIEQLEHQVSKTDWGKTLVKNVDDAPEKLVEPGKVVSKATSMFAGALDAAANAVVVLFIGLYGAYDPGTYTRGFVRLFPPRRRKQAADVLDASGVALWDWLMGRLIAMAIVGVANWLGLWALGVPLAFILGVISGLLTFVPNFGPLIAAVPAVLVAFLQSPTLALYVVILHFIVQTIEGYFLTPLVQMRMVAMPAIVVIGSQVLFTALLGPLGLILATPLATLAMVLINLLYLRDTLGEPADEVDPRQMKQKRHDAESKRATKA
jgi:predicted PurR-regulated permease PerM